MILITICKGLLIGAVLAGVLVFKEKLTVRQWEGVAICFVDTLLFLDRRIVQYDYETNFYNFRTYFD